MSTRVLCFCRVVLALPALAMSMLVAPLALLSFAASAQSSVYESEPNNNPADANKIHGPVILVGSMQGKDQDGYLWTVSDDDARKRWSFELRGVPGALTIAQFFRLDYAANGVDVVRAKKLMQIATRDGLKPVVATDLVFEPGDYLIGIARAGGGQSSGGMFRPPAGSLSFGDSGTPQASATSATNDVDSESGAYRFTIREGARLVVNPSPKTRLSREDAQVTRVGAEFATYETQKSAWYAISFDENHATQRWDIDVQIPVGRTLDATLYNQAAEKLVTARTDNRGHAIFPDLAPEPGTYHVELRRVDELAFVQAISSTAVGQRVSGEEAEPNGSWKTANRIDLSEPVTGRVSRKNDEDFFYFSVDETRSDELLKVEVESKTPGEAIDLCLHDGEGRRLQCRRGTTPLVLPDLLLSPGQWGLKLSRAQEGMEYSITLAGQGPVVRGTEVEPNDTLEFASGVPANNRIKGRFSGKDSDFFRFTVADEPQLWRFQVIGDGLGDVAYYDGAGKQASRVRVNAGQRRVRLENLFLLPGQHYLSVSGKDGGDYTVLARKLGPPDPNGELEPNDDVSRMQRLAIGQTRTGLLADPDDQDTYRFFLANWDHVRLTVQPPADGVVNPSLYWYGDTKIADGKPAGAGEPISITGLFPPGDYHISLRPKKMSDAEYQLKLERLPRFSCAADCEPNGVSNLYLAAPLPANMVLEGRSGDWGDLDVYELPRLAKPSELIIRTSSPVGRLFLGMNRFDREALNYNSDTGGYTVVVPSGGPYQLIVDAPGKDYRLKLEFPNGPKAATATGPLAANLELVLATDEVSAYRENGQQVTGNLKVANTGASELTTKLEVATSDYRWQIDLERDEIKLAPGEKWTVPLSVHVPVDAWADRPVRISVRAYDESGGQSETWAEIGVSREIAAVDPSFGWQIPDSLRGGFNANWAPFGGKWDGDLPDGARFEMLRDGLVFGGSRMECCSKPYGWDADYRPALTVALPGAESLPIAGLALNHFGSPNILRNIRKAALLLSEDGTTFVEALQFETLPVETEQYFTLPEPVMARYARLRIDATFNVRAGANGVTLGEWKVITQPGYDLSNGGGLDLAAPALGGHVVWDSPANPNSPTPIINSNEKSYVERLKPGQSKDYVIGFQHNRAAQIRRIEWVDTDNVNVQHRADRVVLSVSTESSVGPWSRVGELNFDNAGATHGLDLKQPTWARFVRFTAIPKNDLSVLAAPKVIRIWERPTSDDYRSVIGEWGYASRRAFYEQQIGLQPEAELRASNNSSRARAAALGLGELAAGQVALGKQEQWYWLQVPAGDNTLSIALTGDPTVRTIVALEDSNGTAIPLRQNQRDSTTNRHVFTAVVAPGTAVYFQIVEPPRNVVFSWDTSASINHYLPTIYNSLTAFSSQVAPGQEAVNLVPFGYESPLLRDWYGESYVLQTMLNEYPRRESSSSGEMALKTSAQALSPLAGSKAILVVTDGMVVHEGSMWDEMRRVQPRIFGVHIGGEFARNQDVFEDWASVNGGHYDQLNYAGGMEVAFDRAATMLRRPAGYALEVASEYREAPGPGTLRVVVGDGNSNAAGAAVELILDASGSMWQKLGGRFRIDIAKEVLATAIKQHIPAGSPTALRVFGNRNPNDCDTNLVIPLSPLNIESATAKINEIVPQRLAKTPIAASLAAVRKDLQGVAGAALVVLVTDGEETCDGNPAKEIEKLQKAGFNINLNIIGFAIDDRALVAQFETWAEVGNGRYFSANDASALNDAVESALSIPFTAYDAAGVAVAQGVVGGEPVELEQGTYRIVVTGTPSREFRNVAVAGDVETSLEL